MNNVLIESLDYYGYGVCHIDGKVTFVKNALPGEIVDIKITNEFKKYNEAEVINYITKSEARIKSVCPYFGKCGGCNLLFYKYEDTLDFKLNKIKELIKKNNILYTKEIEVVQNENPFNYRNKVSLKIKDGHIGYFKDSTHDLVEIKNCMVANSEINKVIEHFLLLHINNGELIIRVNKIGEVLLIINTQDEINIDIEGLKKYIKLVGIVVNKKTIYGEDYLYERIDGKLFKVSFDSFFQVNPYICEKLFKLIEDNIDENARVLDLYSGVGTLSIVASSKAVKVYSVEIVSNAVLNGIMNAKINKRNNIDFLLGDVSKTVNKIKDKFDTLIVDPPRSGLDSKTLDFIIKNKPLKIIYVSCEPSTLIRDLKVLEGNYNICEYKVLDMFSYSYHLESFVVLELKC